jgi:peroxiredoxin
VTLSRSRSSLDPAQRLDRRPELLQASDSSPVEEFACGSELIYTYSIDNLWMRDSMTEHMTVKRLLADLHAERVATWPAADLQVNIDQRAELVDRFDPSATAQVGDALAPFSFENARGGQIGLDDLVATGPAVLIFFRFAGCPACNVTLPYYRDFLAPGLEDLGVNLAAVSPQVPERLVEIVERHDLPFTVASDPGNTLGKRLGITFTTNEASQRYARAKGADLPAITGTGTWELPQPTALLLDRGRIVRWIEVTPDWMARTDAAPILEAAQRIVGVPSVA